MRNVSIRLGTGLVALVLVSGLQMPSVAANRGARPSKASVSPAIPTERVRIVNFAFQPATTRIEEGTRVVWTNTGSVRHTSTSNSGVWNSGSIAPGGTFSHRFNDAGTFRYHCSIHHQMHGKIVVH